jgi:hypothetical protein
MAPAFFPSFAFNDDLDVFDRNYHPPCISTRLRLRCVQDHRLPSSRTMSFASALNILRSTLPAYVALTKYDLLHLDANTFQFRPHPKAPCLALEMAKTVLMMDSSTDDPPSAFDSPSG